MAAPKVGEVYYAEDGTASMVLEETYDPTYEPTQQELDEYAAFIGIDAKAEADLMWIAREALKAPLPAEWKPCKTDAGEVYYFNFKTGDSIWEHPLDEHYKTKVADERSKLQGSAGSKKKKSDSSKKEKLGGETEPAVRKLEKGGGAAAESPLAKAASAKGVSEPPTRQRVGRLGALGTAASDKAAKPDISDILPPKPKPSSGSPLTSLPATGLGLGSSKPDPLKLAAQRAEEERKLKASLKEGQQEELDRLKARHQREIESRQAELDLLRDTTEKELRAQHDVELTQGKRSLVARLNKERTERANSQDRELEELRREVAEMRQRVDSATTAAERRRQRVIDQKKLELDRTVLKDVQRKRTDLQDAWMKEKAQAELDTAATIRDLQAEHQLTLDAINRQKSAQRSAAQAELEEQLTNELNALRRQLDEENRQYSLQRAMEQEALGHRRTQEAAAAEQHYHETIRAAHDEAAGLVSVARLEVAKELEQEETRFRYEQQQIHAEHSAAELQRSSLAAANTERELARLRQEAEQRLMNDKAAIDAEVETQLQRRKAAAAARGMEVAKEYQMKREAAEAAHQERLRQLEVQANAELESKKSQWRLAHDSQASDAKLQLDRRVSELDRLYDAEKQRIQRERDQELSDQRAKAKRDCDARIAAYSQQKSVSPLRKTRALEAAKRESDARLEALKLSLQKELAAAKDAKASRDRERSAGVKHPDTAPLVHGETHATIAPASRPYHHATPSTEALAAIPALNPYLESTHPPSSLEAAPVQRLTPASVVPSSEPFGQLTAAPRGAEITERPTSRSHIAARDSQLLVQSVPPPQAQHEATAVDWAEEYYKYVETRQVEARPKTVVAPQPSSEAQPVPATTGLPPQSVKPVASHQVAKQAPNRTTSTSAPGSHSERVVPVEEALAETPTRQARRRGQPAIPHPGADVSRDRTTTGTRRSRFEDRVLRAREIILKKKMEIRAQQKEIETAREEWRRDWQRAKAASDVEHQAVLHRVKRNLEDQARKCNEQALEVRSASQWIKEQEILHQQRKAAEREKAGAAVVGGLADWSDPLAGASPRSPFKGGSPARHKRLPEDPVAKSGDLRELLRAMATKISALESEVHILRATHPSGHRDPNERPSSGVTSPERNHMPQRSHQQGRKDFGGDAAALHEKWSRWLREEPGWPDPQRAHPKPRPASPAKRNPKLLVEHWLDQTADWS